MKIVNNVLMSIEESDIIDGVLKLPDTVEVIEKQVINNLLTLKRFISNGLIEVKTCNFYNCINLEYFKADRLEKIGSFSFMYCDSLISIDLPNLLIVSHSFVKCNNLETAKFERLEENVLRYNFVFCESIKSVITKNGKINVKGVDGDCLVIRSTKKVRNYTVYRANILGHFSNFYLVKKDNLHADGSTIKEAIENYESTI